MADYIAAAEAIVDELSMHLRDLPIHAAIFALVRRETPHASSSLMAIHRMKAVLAAIFYPAVMQDSLAKELVDDDLARASGKQSRLDVMISPRKLRDAALVRTKLERLMAVRACFDSGRDKTTWMTAHASIYPGIGENLRRQMRKLIDAGLRNLLRSAGIAERNGEKLTPEQETARILALRYEPEYLRECLDRVRPKRRAPTRTKARKPKRGKAPKRQTVSAGIKFRKK